MTDLGGALLVAVATSFGVIVMTAALVAEHTSVRVLRLPEEYTRAPSPNHRTRTLIVELLWVTLIFGGGEIVVILALLHPTTTLPVRLVAVAQLAGMGAWFVYVAKAIRRT